MALFWFIIKYFSLEESSSSEYEKYIKDGTVWIQFKRWIYLPRFVNKTYDTMVHNSIYTLQSLHFIWKRSRRKPDGQQNGLRSYCTRSKSWHVLETNCCHFEFYLKCTDIEFAYQVKINCAFVGRWILWDRKLLSNVKTR